MQLEFIKEYFGIISAAVIGAFIGTASKRNDSSLMIVVSLVSGISCAIFFTPIIVDYCKVDTKIDYAVAYLLGLFGMAIVSILMAVMDTLRNNPKEIISFVKDVFLKDKTTIINNYKDDNK